MQLDTMLFHQTQLELDKNSDDKLFPRVTEDEEVVENYRIAKELSDQGKGTFTQVINDLNKAENHKNAAYD